MAAPNFADSANVEELIAYISTELIPQRVAALALARPRRILRRSTPWNVGANSGLIITGFTGAAGDGGGGITYGDGVLTIGSDGIYEVEYSAVTYGTVTAQMTLALILNTSTTVSSASTSRSGSGQEKSVIGAARVALTAGDELTLSYSSVAGASTIQSVRWSIEKVA